uniref:hypothetical protein n=1 Tax=Candidatus Electronema sp. TaxID=2698783 RepID=UPI0040561564
MAHLVNCFKCGSKISSEANICPKCNIFTGEYQGQCKLCCRVDKQANLITYKNRYGGEHFAHAECLSKIRNECDSFVYICTVCQEKVGADTVRCPSCGYPVPYWLKTTDCKWCELSVVIGAAKKCEGYHYIRYYHQSCYKYSDDIAVAQ